MANALRLVKYFFLRTSPRRSAMPSFRELAPVGQFAPSAGRLTVHKKKYFSSLNDSGLPYSSFWKRRSSDGRQLGRLGQAFECKHWTLHLA